MFSIGDIVRCKNSYQLETFTSNGRRARVAGLVDGQRFVIYDVTNFRDGSQSIWVRYSPRSKSSVKDRRGGYDEVSIRGPYSSVRFSLESKSIPIMNDYDPTQQGDRDDDI